MSNLLKTLLEFQTVRPLARLARGLRLRPPEQGGRNMNSHDSIAPTKVGNPRTESAAGRSLSLRDLFLSLVYGLLFGSLAFLTGCLEGGGTSGSGRSPGSDSRSDQSWSTDDYEDPALAYLSAPDLADRLQEPLTEEQPLAQWRSISVYRIEELEKALVEQREPLLIRIQGELNISKEYEIRFPAALDASPSSLFPKASLTFTKNGAFRINILSRTSQTKCKDLDGTFEPSLMSYVGLFGDILRPTIRATTRTHLVISTTNPTVVEVIASAPSLVVSKPGPNTPSSTAETFTSSLAHTIFLSGGGMVPNRDAPALVLSQAYRNSSGEISRTCMKSYALAMYDYHHYNADRFDPMAREQSIRNNRLRCESERWNDVVEAVTSCTRETANGGAQ